MKKIIYSFSFILIIFFTMLSLKCFAEAEVTLDVSDNSIQRNEEITVTANLENENIAAYTIWLYYDSQKVECISKEENINVMEDKVICTWFSETGKDKDLKELANLKFKAKQDGVALFNIIAELYDENGGEIGVKYNQMEVEIGEEKQANNTEKIEETVENNAKDDDDTLQIMRVNMEGINPDFDKNIKEYYLIVDEKVKKLDITAVPSNNESQVIITGNDNLKNGLNKIKIKITSKAKSKTSEYVINVTKTENTKNANADLETLAVEYFDLSPEFNKNITNYYVDISNEVNKLNIFAVSSDESAKVAISGNENFKIGDNQIIINVTAKNGITTKKYYINAHRRSDEEEIKYEEESQNIIEEANVVLEQMEAKNNEIDEESESSKENEKKKNKEDSMIILLGSILVIVIIGIVVIIKIHKKGK